MSKASHTLLFPCGVQTVGERDENKNTREKTVSKRSEYYEKLKDPRWQKKRLEIFERDQFACRSCHCDFEMLAVHHVKYLPNTEPWDYPDSLLITLCEGCHENERDNRKEIEQFLIDQLKERGFMVRDIENLAGQIMEGVIIPDSAKKD
jgi:hypothetical protein